jgi:DNA-binding transcriptional regulator YdaS (Cro superfamily)
LQKKFHYVELYAMSIWDERQSDVARRLGKPKSVICRWFKLRRVPIRELDDVERIYGDKREDLRPDVPWRKQD